jgi:hypothetical protein
MIFMQEYEKYGNNCMQIAKVLSTRTPAQIKKHAECFFKQADRAYGTEISPWSFVISFVILLYAISYNICI